MYKINNAANEYVAKKIKLNMVKFRAIINDVVVVQCSAYFKRSYNFKTTTQSSVNVNVENY